MKKLTFGVSLYFFIATVSIFAQNNFPNQEINAQKIGKNNLSIYLTQQDADSILTKYNHFFVSQKDSALKYAQEYLLIAEQINNLEMKVRAYANLAEVYCIWGTTEHILKYCRLGLYENSKLRNKLYDVQFYILLSRAYTLQNIADKALSYGLQAMKIAKDVKSEKYVAKSAESIANVYYFVLKDYEKSISYYTINADYYLKYEPQFAAGVLSNLGNNHYQHKQYDEAFKLYEKAYEISKENNDIYGMGYSIDNMGLACRRKKDFVKAHQYFEKGLAYRKATKSKTEIVNSLNHLALSELQFNNITKALQYGEDNLRLSKEVKNYDLIVEALQTLVTIKEKEGNYKDIILLQKQIINFQDSLYLQRNEVQTREIAAKDEFIQAEQENELLKKENLYKETRLEFQNIAIWIVTFAGILIFIFLLIALWERQKQKKAKQKIEQKNNIIEANQIQLSAQNKELARLNEVQNQLFSIIGHDLRSPIASMLGILELTGNRDISQEEFFDFSDSLNNNVKNIHLLLENLLAWSILQRNGGAIIPKNVHLQPLITFKLQLYKEQAKKKHIQLISEIDNNIIVYADDNHLQFVFRNLIANAIKFTNPEGKITVKAQNMTDKEIEFVEIYITDTGVGMSSEQIATLFKPEKQFTTQGTAGEKGTGLGLKFCKDFIEKNNGTLTVSSIINEGTTFCVKLPIGIEL